MGLSLNVRGHVAFFQQNPRVWEFLTASLEEKNSKRNRELENFANFGSRVCEDLVYFYTSKPSFFVQICMNNKGIEHIPILQNLRFLCTHVQIVEVLNILQYFKSFCANLCVLCDCFLKLI